MTSRAHKLEQRKEVHAGTPAQMAPHRSTPVSRDPCGQADSARQVQAKNSLVLLPLLAESSMVKVELQAPARAQGAQVCIMLLPVCTHKQQVGSCSGALSHEMSKAELSR